MLGYRFAVVVADVSQMLRETCSHLKPRPLALKYGIPQGFVPGSVLFALCIQPLSNIISQCDCNCHKYYDDTSSKILRRP